MNPSSFGFMLVLSACSILTSAASASEIRVPEDQPTIADALSVAGEGDTVVLAPGTYGVFSASGLPIPAPSVMVRGATGDALDVVIGCDLGPALFTVSGFRGITFADLTITNCRNALQATNDAGVTLLNVVFVNNRPAGSPASVVTGIGSDLVVDGCVFINNTAEGTALSTGTISVFAGSLQVRGSTFTLNTTTLGSTPSRFGAAIFGGVFNSSGSDGGSTITVEDSSFVANQADFGAAVAIRGGDVTIDRCLFAENESTLGGAVFVGSGVSSVIVPGSMLVSNSVFTGNSSVRFGTPPNALNGFGGAAAVDANAQLDLVNVTLAFNSAETFGGAVHTLTGGTATVANAILTENTPDDASGAASTILPSSLLGPRDSFVFVDPAGADGMFGTADDNLRLSAGSPAIDAGDNSAALGHFDLDANPRFVDDITTPDSGSGAAPVVDLGAFEFPGFPCNDSDIANPFGVLDIADLNEFLARIADNDPSADLNNDTETDFFDVAIYLNSFENGCP